MKILIDMNLPPTWTLTLSEAGWDTVHWSEVGPPNAPDETIMEWARDRVYVVFTHDLDFGALLAASKSPGPSVIQVKTQNVMPGHLAPVVIAALRQFEETLVQGALVTVDEEKSRARILPFG